MKLKKFVSNITQVYNIKKIKRGENTRLIQDISQALTQTKLMNFLETENLEAQKFTAESTWDEMDKELARVKDFCDEEKLEKDYSRILRQKLTKVQLFNHQKKLKIQKVYGQTSFDMK